MKTAPHPASATAPAPAKTPPRKPVHSARIGNVTIDVYRDGRNRSGSQRYCIPWRQHAGASITRERFSGPEGKKKAIARADEIARAIANGQADVLTLSAADRDHYRSAVLALAPLGIPLSTAIEEYVAARSVLPAQVSLLHAAQKTAAEHGKARPQLPPALELATRLVAELQAHPLKPRSHKRVRELRSRLKAFATQFPDMTAPQRSDLEAYLLTVGKAKTHDNHLGAIRQLYRYARHLHMWPLDRPLPTDGIPTYYQPGEPETFGAPVLKKILAVTDPYWIPFVAIGAFAGLRPTEIFRLSWQHFRWEEKVIAVPRSVALKVLRPRLAPIPDNLAAWLAPYRDRIGRVYPKYTIRTLQDRQSDFIAFLKTKIEGLTWPEDVLRHSFGSHRLAEIKNRAQVVIEMGTSEAMLQRHYNNPKTEAEAKTWFSILPDPDRAIISIPPAAIK